MIRKVLIAVAVLVYVPHQAQAEVVEFTAQVKSVDSDSRTITVVRKTANGEKPLVLEVAKKVGDLSGLKRGDAITVSYDPDIEIVVSLSGSSTASESNVRVYPNHNAVILALAFTPDGKYVATGTDDCTIRMWSTDADGDKSEPESVVHRVQQGDKRVFLTALDISPDGKQMASALSDGSVRLWEREKEKWMPGQTLDKLSGITTPVVFSGDGKLLATVERQPGVVRLWDVSGSKVSPKSEPLAPPGAIAWSVAFAGDNESLFVGLMFPPPQGAGGQVVLWSPADGPRLRKPIASGLSGVPRSASASPDGKVLAVGDNGFVRLYSLPDNEPLSVIDTNKAQKAVVRIVFSPDGKLIATGGYYPDVQIWDLESAKVVDTLTGDFGLPGKGVEGLAFSPDGTTVAIGSKDGLLRLWRYRQKL